MVIRRVLIDLVAADWGAPWFKSVGWGRRPTCCDGPFLFLRRAHFDGSHRGLCLSTGFVNCISSQCYRSYVRDQGLIDNSTFLCRAIMHDIKFCGPNRRRNKRDYDCYQGHFHCKQPRSRCTTIYNVRFTPENGHADPIAHHGHSHVRRAKWMRPSQILRRATTSFARRPWVDVIDPARA
jgi:hypothetical protein